MCDYILVSSCVWVLDVTEDCSWRYINSMHMYGMIINFWVIVCQKAVHPGDKTVYTKEKISLKAARVFLKSVHTDAEVVYYEWKSARKFYMAVYKDCLKAVHDDDKAVYKVWISAWKLSILLTRLSA